ncbi:hypothetical protein [Williamsia sterculiae]|uniref:VRR-NUC domain-containing protein n=1 Tax=Williamsia sterculiae TaxID=1344003 RepID=A0A1N7GHQ9_9NOCA|nr:hypothetical protein [Williamsia sterculiae]SIS12121.1 hypothetical protein SAMN05445060_2806 [Williamsia sterculiae]
MTKANVENGVYRLIALHLRRKYPDVMFHFDLSGVHNPSRYSRGLYAELNGTRGWPDLHIAARSHPLFGSFIGLYIEIKADGTTIRKRDGSLVADPHIREQAEVIKRLNATGHYAAFGVGYQSCKQLIDAYLTGSAKEIVEF